MIVYCFRRFISTLCTNILYKKSAPYRRQNKPTGRKGSDRRFIRPETAYESAFYGLREIIYISISHRFFCVKKIADFFRGFGGFRRFIFSALPTACFFYASEYANRTKARFFAFRPIFFRNVPDSLIRYVRRNRRSEAPLRRLYTRGGEVPVRSW